MQVLVVCLALCVVLRGSLSHDDDHGDHDHEVAVSCDLLAPRASRNFYCTRFVFTTLCIFLLQDCPITANSFASTYMNNVEAMGIVDPQTGQPCSLPYESSSYYDLSEFHARSVHLHLALHCIFSIDCSIGP